MPAIPMADAQTLSRVQLFVTPWTIACQAPLSMGFSRQEYWSGLPFPSPIAVAELMLNLAILKTGISSEARTASVCSINFSVQVAVWWHILN